MKRILYSLIISGSCVAMYNSKRFEQQHQRDIKKLELYHNHHFTQMRFNQQNTHTMRRLYKQRDYTPKSKNR